MQRLIVALFAVVAVASASAIPPEFENAKDTHTLQIWRAEDFTPVPVKESEHGQFYKGDSYVIYDNRDNRPTRFVHFLLGEDSSTDEQASAAIFALQLAKVTGAPRTIREEPGKESANFRKIFNGSIKYLDGGVDSAFN